VTELTPTEAENPLSGYGKTVSHVIVGLKTVKGTKQLRLDPTIYEAILKEKIVVGDVVYIEANTGAVKVYLMLIFSQSPCPLKVRLNSVLDVQMPMLPRMIWNQKHMCPCRKERYINVKN